MRIALLTQVYSAIVSALCDIISPQNLVIVDFSKDDALIDFCLKNRIKHIRFDSWRQIISELSGLDLIVSYKLNKIIPIELLSRIRYGGLNIHPSLLPKYRGSNPWFQMYYNMETDGGVTIHRLSEVPDSGNIIIHRPFRIEPGQPLPSAIKTADSLACDLITEVIDKELYLGSGVKQDFVNEHIDDNIDLNLLKDLPVHRLWHVLRGFPSLIHTLYPSLPHEYFEVGEYIQETIAGEVGSIRANEKGQWIVCNDGLISLFDFSQIPMTRDYMKAIESAYFADTRLKQVSFELNKDGSLNFTQGREAIVFPAIMEGDKVAVRFIRNLTSEQIPAYVKRQEKLLSLFRQNGLIHFPDYEVVRDAIKLPKGFFPAIIMKWAQGLNLIPFLKHNIHKKQLLIALLSEFIKCCRRNHIAGIAHGDLHSGNIIVDKYGQFHIIDIDKTWHPLFGQVRDSSGNCNYQHPIRKFNK